MVVPYWILGRTQTPSVENGVARVHLTDGRESKTVILRLKQDARAFLEANAFADGPDSLFVGLIRYWADERRNSTRGWIPQNEVLDKDEVERFNALYGEHLKQNSSSHHPVWF